MMRAKCRRHGHKTYCQIISTSSTHFLSLSFLHLSLSYSFSHKSCCHIQNCLLYNCHGCLVIINDNGKVFTKPDKYQFLLLWTSEEFEKSTFLSKGTDIRHNALYGHGMITNTELADGTCF